LGKKSKQLQNIQITQTFKDNEADEAYHWISLTSLKSLSYYLFMIFLTTIHMTVVPIRLEKTTTRFTLELTHNVYWLFAIIFIYFTIVTTHWKHTLIYLNSIFQLNCETVLLLSVWKVLIIFYTALRLTTCD
jgi:hypothetical protein